MPRMNRERAAYRRSAITEQKREHVYRAEEINVYDPETRNKFIVPNMSQKIREETTRVTNN